MPRRTLNPISIDEITKVLVDYGPTLKMEKIKEYVYLNRDARYFDYETKYSFDQTIQAKVQSHTRGGSGFKEGKEIFEHVFTGGFYKLKNHQDDADKVIKSPDDFILSLTTGNLVEDLELTNRTLREINSINRDKALVVGLKKLYDNQCQLCGAKLEINNGDTYSEVHHIKPLGQPHNGSDTSANMMVVCPNCHIQLDFKAVRLLKEKITFIKPHDINDENIEYANMLCEEVSRLRPLTNQSPC